MPRMMEREEEVLGYKLKIMSFVLGGRYYARVHSVEHDREIARSEGNTREKAEQQALEFAKKQLNYIRLDKQS